MKEKPKEVPKPTVKKPPVEDDFLSSYKDKSAKNSKMKEELGVCISIS